jgi:plasmid maintenance system antidote protein VapI
MHIESDRLLEDAMAKKLKPMHPGEVLREEFLVPLRLASHADRADRQRTDRHYRRYCASARQGARHDGTLLWLNLQNDYDIQIAKHDLGKLLDRIKTVNKPKAA